MDYEEKYEQLQALKKLRNNMALFGKHCFPTALKKATPHFTMRYMQIYQMMKSVGF